MYIPLPEESDYYGILFNELAINEKVMKSKLVCDFPKLLFSMEEWNMDSVYEIIKSRLEELHLLGFSHNDRPTFMDLCLAKFC